MRTRRGESPAYLDVTYRRATELVGEELAGRLFPATRPGGDDFVDDLFQEVAFDGDRRWLPTACRYDGSPRPYCKKAVLFLGAAGAIIGGVPLLFSFLTSVDQGSPHSLTAFLLTVVLSAIVFGGASTVMGVTGAISAVRRMKVAGRPVSMADAGQLVDLLSSMKRHGIPVDQAVKDRVQSMESFADLRNADLEWIAGLLATDLTRYRCQFYSNAARMAAEELGGSGHRVHDGENPAGAEAHQ